MRKILMLLLTVAITMIGVPGGVSAQAPAAVQGAAISGQAVDAGGRALVGQRVDLVLDGQILQSTTTGLQGEWSFTNLAADEYVVRMSINEQAAGVLVPVASGQAVANTLIVAPSVAAPSAAFLGNLGTVGGVLVGAAVVAAIVTTAIIVTGS